MDVELAAAEIMQARRAGRCLDASTLPIDESMAYPVQHLLTRWREGQGERQVGWKLGYTSAAMREQMGIASPNYGPLTDAMLVASDGHLPHSLQPKVEPEIALVMAHDLTEALTPDECRRAVASAHLALEIVDSIWCDYRFTWAHNTADGSSAAYVVVGPELPATNLADITVDLQRNGEPAGTGLGAAAMGDPYAALAWLTTALHGQQRRLRAGDVVITGGLCAAVPLMVGDRVQARAADVLVSVQR